jgi:hypothetical protein
MPSTVITTGADHVVRESREEVMLLVEKSIELRDEPGEYTYPSTIEVQERVAVLNQIGEVPFGEMPEQIPVWKPCTIWIKTITGVSEGIDHLC